MKFPSVCIIINILVIFIIFSLAEDLSDPDIKEIHTKTVEDDSKSPENPEDEENQKLKTNASITKLPGNESDKFTTECSAIIHGENCPVPPCNATGLRERRKRAPLLISGLVKLAAISYLINKGMQNQAAKDSKSSSDSSVTVPPTVAPPKKTKA